MAFTQPGPGDTAHVYLADIGPDLLHEDLDNITYDDATSQLLVVKGGHVFAYDVSKGPGGNGSLKWMYPLQEGPSVIALRASLDNRMLAVQRSAAMLELVDLASGMCFVHSIHKGRGDILCFFFTDAPDTDVVIVTSRAVELTQFAARRQGLRCRDRIRCSNAWAKYTHETRMVLVGSATPPQSALAAWQFASHGITHLPLFELQGPLPSFAAARQSLPAAAGPPAPAASGSGVLQARQSAGPGPGTARLASAASATVGPTAATPAAAAAGQARTSGQPSSTNAVSSVAASAHKGLSAEQLWLLKIHGRVYLAHVDSAAKRLELYRFYSDTTLLEHVYELISVKVQLSVADNTLLVHHLDTSVVMLFDVALGHSCHLANPLPLRRLRLLPPALAAAVLTKEQQAVQDQQQQQRPGNGAQQQQQQQPAAGLFGNASGINRSSSRTIITPSATNFSETSSTEQQLLLQPVGEVYEASDLQHTSSWRYYVPGYVLDMDSKLFGRLQLDLQAIADSAGDLPVLVGFLLYRRSLPTTAPLAVEPRLLMIQVTRGALQERVGLGVLRQVFDLLLKAYADAVARMAASEQSAVAGPAAAAAAAAMAAAYPGSSTGSITWGGTAAASPVQQQLLLNVPAVTVIAPNELARDLFQWVHEEEVVDALYLQAAVSEYLAASDALALSPPTYLQLLAVDLLLQQQQHYQAVQLLCSQPGTGSLPLARHLLDVASKGGVSAGVHGAVGSPAGAAAGVPGYQGDASKVGSRGILGRQAVSLSQGTPSPITGLARPASSRGLIDAANPGSAMALELAVDIMARQAVPEIRPLGGGIAAPAAGGSDTTGSSGMSPRTAATAAAINPVSRLSAAALVRQLLHMGQVLQAVRVARNAGGIAAIQLPAAAFVEAAAAAGDAGVLVAVYRVLRPHVLGTWPNFESIRAHYWGDSAMQAAA